jgi:hypothetical protein
LRRGSSHVPRGHGREDGREVGDGLVGLVERPVYRLTVADSKHDAGSRDLAVQAVGELTDDVAVRVDVAGLSLDNRQRGAFSATVTRRAARLVGLCAGTVVGLLLCIAYDTSANVATLEGGHAHLVFAKIVIYSLLAGVIGALVGWKYGERR